MTGDTRELYQQVILDHYKSPRNKGKPKESNREAEGRNPLCGDQVRIYVQLDGDKISDVAFEGQGCAISTASASVMTESLKGKNEKEVRDLFETFHRLLTDKNGNVPSAEKLGKLAVFSGVQEFPIRVKCASLAWHTLRAALDNEKDPITTE